MRIETINEMVNALAYRQDLERIHQALLRQGATHAAENIACALREADRDLQVFAQREQPLGHSLLLQLVH